MRQSYLASYVSTTRPARPERLHDALDDRDVRTLEVDRRARVGAQWRALTDSGDVENTSAPSIHSAHTGLTCGGPSARAVHSQ